MQCKGLSLAILVFSLSNFIHVEVIEAKSKQRTIAASQKLKSQKTTSRNFQKKAPQESNFLNYLPFGFGQFQQEKTWLGAGLAAAQAGSLFLYFDRLQQIKSANNDATVVFNSSDLQKDTGLYEFFESNEAFVKRTQQESQIALLSFVSLYAFGVYDALYDPFQLKSSGKKKRKKELLEEDYSWESHEFSNSSSSIRMAKQASKEDFSLGLGTIPTPKLSYGVFLKTSF